MAVGPDDIDRDIAQAVERERTVVPAPFEDEKVNSLPVQVSVYVPSTRNGENISQGHFENRIDFTRKWFSSHFGGDMTVRASGGYIGEDGTLVEEAVAVVESSTTINDYIDALGDFRKFIRRRRENWGQDTIGYKIEGQFYVYPQRPYIDDEVTIPTELVEVQ